MVNSETSRVKTLEQLGDVLGRGEPGEVIYDLGEGRERTELLLTYIDGNRKITDRIESSLLITLSEDDHGIISMEIIDSDKKADGYLYRGLIPQGVDFEPPTYPPYDLGYLVVDLEDDRKLTFCPYFRPA